MQLTELVAPPTEGRVFTDRARAGLGDVAPSGRVRLDTIARWLQDAAFADLLDSGVPDDGVWIVRRLRLRVERFPRMHEHVSVATWCSGAGEPRGRAAQHGARRRRRARRSRGAVGAPRSGGRAAAPDAGGLRGRLRPVGGGAPRARAAALPRRAAGGWRRRAPWRFRAADLDLADHVNNAVYWQALEEDLAGDGAREPFDAEIEHRAPADVGEAALVRDGEMLWISAADGEVLASLATPGGPAVRVEISTSA